MLAVNHKRLLPPEFYDALNSVKPDIINHIQQIKTVLDAYDKSDYKSAQEVFDIMMDELNDDFLVRSINGINPIDPKLYRVRRVNSETEKLKKPSDLFHIPYTKRKLITNERYSLAGHPCLYLATYLGIAWQECNYPSKFYYSEFQYQYAVNEKQERDYINDWKFITLLRPRQVAQDFLCALNSDRDDFRCKFFSSYVKSYPLLFACSIVNLSGDSTFKSEFIIPQMLMQWVRRNIKTVRGVTYFSCIDNDNLRHLNGYNIAIPAVRFNENGYCIDLIEKFKVSEPLYCNNLIEKTKREKVAVFKKDLLTNINGFPLEAAQCINDIYEICNCFYHLLLRVEKLDMKLVIQTLFSLRINYRFIQSNYNKEEIRTKAFADSHSVDEEERISLFEQYYDRFFKEVGTIISQYIHEVEKIDAATFPTFYTVI